MKISIITATYNSESTLSDTLSSVLKQTYPDIEYLIIDGASTDGTIALIDSYEPLFNGKLKWISEKDQGIYDAMNKGLRMATGDVIGILNSDDYFTRIDIIEKIATHFKDEEIDAVYGDIHFIKDGKPNKCTRYYSSERFSPRWLRFGFMPAHPSFYARRSVYERAGYYKTDYKIGADFEMMVRLSKRYNLRAKYLKMDFVTMRTGGTSTRNINSRLTLLQEDVRACKENGVYTNLLLTCIKYFYKVFELRW